MSTPRYLSARPSLSGSAISVSNATTPSRPGVKSDIWLSCSCWPAAHEGPARRPKRAKLTTLPINLSHDCLPSPAPVAARGSVPMGLAADPHDQFDRWMADVIAAGLPEPTAMVLATVSAAGQPRARTVLLKGHDK